MSLYSSILYDHLGPLLAELNRKGVSVTPSKHIELLRVLDKFRDRITAENLLDYIGPVLIKNEEQRKILEEVYRKFAPGLVDPKIEDDKNETDEKKKKDEPDEDKRPWHERHRIALSIAVTAGAILIVWWIIQLSLFKMHEANALFEADYSSNFSEPVFFNARGSVKDPDDARHLTFTWDFGDGTSSKEGSEVSHVYTVCGTYKVKLHIASNSATVKVRKAITEHLIVRRAALTIRSSNRRTFTIGDEGKFNLNYDSLHPPSNRCAWYVNDEKIAENTFDLSYFFNTEGLQRIQFVADSTESCTPFEATLDVNVKAPVTEKLANLSVVTVQQGTPFAPSRVMTRAAFWGVLLIGSIPVVLLLAMVYLKAQRDKKAKAITDRFRRRTPPYDIAFKNHDILIDDEKLLIELANNFKRRNEGDSVRINMSKTIATTVRMEGVPHIVWSKNTKPIEYLFLIDSSAPKNQQIRLFEYLLKRIQQNDVVIHKFYFTTRTDIFFNPEFPEGVHISRLYDLYPEHVLVILGNGNPFMDSQYPVPDETKIQPFRKWAQWAICTPVPFTDWGQRERGIQKKDIMLLPSDLSGMLLLFQAFDSDPATYEKRLQDIAIAPLHRETLRQIPQLEKYLDDDFLFQWICAIAVYPRIQWDVLISIGDAISKSYERADINYTTLLKISRIPWMQQGSFPDGLRLALLKRLEPRHEKTARETMLRLMDEVAGTLSPDSIAFGEVSMQQMTDKFLLYAQNKDGSPATYQQSYDEFSLLWESGKIMDFSLRRYLKKDPSSKADWSTLIENNLEGTATGKPIDHHLSRVTRVTPAKLSFAAIASAIAILLVSAIFIFNGSISRTSWGKKFYSTSHDVPVTFNLKFNDCYDSLRMAEDSTRYVFWLPGNEKYVLTAQKPTFTMNLNYALLRDSVRWTMISNTHEYTRLPQPLDIRKPDISFSMTGCPAPPCNTWVPLSAQAQQAFISKISGAYFSAESILNPDEDYFAPAYFDRHGNITIEEEVAYKIVDRIYQCQQDKNMYRVIAEDLLDRVRTYDVLYMNTTSRDIAFGESGPSFESIAMALRDRATPDYGKSIRWVISGTDFIDGAAKDLQALNGIWENNSGDDILLDISDGILNLNHDKHPIQGILKSESSDPFRMYKILVNSTSGKSRTRYYVAVRAFPERDAANDYKQELDRQKYNANVLFDPVDQSYNVCIFRTYNKGEADEEATQIRRNTEFSNAYVVDIQSVDSRSYLLVCRLPDDKLFTDARLHTESELLDSIGTLYLMKYSPHVQSATEPAVTTEILYQDDGYTLKRFDITDQEMKSTLFVSTMDPRLWEAEIAGLEDASGYGVVPYDLPGTSAGEPSVILGSAFVKSFRPLVPKGFLKINGNEISAMEGNGYNGIVGTAEGKLDLDDIAIKDLTELDGGFQSGPVLVRNGSNAYRQSRNSNVTDTRAFVGINKQGQIIAAITDGPVSLAELSRFLSTTNIRELRCLQAINLAGGGSETMVVRTSSAKQDFFMGSYNAEHSALLVFKPKRLKAMAN
jgi:hypothetical protein